MPLAPGTRLGPYEVTAQIGQGGMGEVWRATDTNLGRQVAIKVLPDAFAQDGERLARFEREAKTLAALNHPNIAAIYGLEKADGARALVMELVEGPTLADRIARGPLPVEDALPIAKQIAEALEAAHEQGIIHRDLKPANVKVRDDGTVKVLDFGLAKAMEPTAASGDMSHSPTITSPAMTQAGVILGTAAYMSPEQARGKPVDKRADIWAFGAVLYEMVTGRRLFAGDDLTETIAAVVKDQPDLTAAPRHIHRLLRKCLEKDPRKRLHDIGDAWELLGDTAANEAALPGRSQVIWASAVAVSIALTAVAVWLLKPTPPATLRVVRLSHHLGDEQFTSTSQPAVAISADGTHVVYVADGQLYLRDLSKNESEARPIADDRRGRSDNEVRIGAGVSAPFFSPDGGSVGFLSGSQLWKVPITGGTPVPLCEVRSSAGASWTPTGWIVFGDIDGIKRVSENGGDPQLLLASKSGERVYGPQILPDGETILYSVADQDKPPAQQWNQAQIVLQPLQGGERKVLAVRGAAARYLPTGHLVYAVANTLFAVRFDLTQLAVVGTPLVVVEDMGRPRTGAMGTAHFSVSDEGTLAYVPSMALEQPRTLLWVDRQGREEALGVTPGGWVNPRLSPDGSTIAIERRGDGPVDVWLWDVAARHLRPFTTDPAPNYLTAWFPDSRRLALTYITDKLPRSRVYRQNADGSGSPQPFQENPNLNEAHFPYAVTADGSLVYGVYGSGTRSIALLPPKGSPRLLVNAPAIQARATVSPSERWMAFDSNRTGRAEVYVREFPVAEGPEWSLTTAGACCPVWARDGSELYYWKRTGQSVTIAAVPIRQGPTFSWGTAREVAQGNYAQIDDDTPYDVAKDGRFLVVKQLADQNAEAEPQVRIVLNWFEELKRLVPTN